MSMCNVAVSVCCRCVDELSELLSLLEENPSVEYSTLVRDEEENFQVWSRWEVSHPLFCVALVRRGKGYCLAFVLLGST